MNSHNFIKAAAAGALALNGGVSDSGIGETNTCNVGDDTCQQQQQLPMCPRERYLRKYHQPRVCETSQRTSRPEKGSHEREFIYSKLKESGAGASLVPNQQTVTCPIGKVQSLENEMAVKGFDTTWIVENTSTKHVVVAWIIDGIEYSPFHPDMKAIDDPMAVVKPGDWISVPTFESFVYHVREIIDDGALGNIVLQHRIGMIPIGEPSDNNYCDSTTTGTAKKPLDVEPYTPGLELKQIESGRLDTRDRPCNTIDIGFRNQVGCPLSVYYASTLTEVPDKGFSCDEKYKFHMGTQDSSQDFMWDWNSATKYEGSVIGHTFVARLASDPSIIIQKYTLEPTKIIDCPTSKKQQVVPAVLNGEAEEVTITQGTTLPSADDETEERLMMIDSVPLLATASIAHGISG